MRSMQQALNCTRRCESLNPEAPIAASNARSRIKPTQEPTMNRYETSLPRVAISIAAVAMTAITLGLSILPAQIGNDGRVVAPGVEIARGKAALVEMAAAQGTPIVGTPIVVYGYREQTDLRRVHMPHVTPPQKQQI
jgi:hypothetical protein